MMRSQRIKVGDTRRGLVIVVVLVCIAVMTVLFGTLLKGTLAWRRQVRAEASRSQVEWMADSGVARAIAKTKTEPDYAGEEWKPNAFENSGDVATVTIDVTKKEQTQITVVARVVGTRPVTVERTLTIPNQKDDNDD